MNEAPSDAKKDRLEAWYDGSAICVVAVGSHGDPLDLADHEVRRFVGRLEACLSESQNSPLQSHGSAESIATSATSTLSDLSASWARTLRHLSACRYYLPEVLSGEAAGTAEQNLVHYLHHNELGLAFAEAEALGEATGAPIEFWRELKLAAVSMEMHEAVNEYALRHGV